MSRCVNALKKKKRRFVQKWPVCVDTCVFVPIVLIRPAAQCFCTPHYSFGRFVVAQLI